MNAPFLHAISPIFQVANLQRGIDFYTKVMGFELGGTWGSPPDRAVFCRDGVEITLEVATQPRHSHVYIYLKDVDAYYEKVTAANAEVIYPLADRVYGMRDCRIADPDGNHIALGEELPQR